MNREDFKLHVEETIESFIQETERRIGQRLDRRYCFNWIGAKTDPIPQDQVADYITKHVYIDEQHIYPCFDIGVGDMLDDGRLLLIGSRAGYAPCTWRKNWTGRDGPFVFLLGKKFTDRYPSAQISGVKESLASIVRVAHSILNSSTGIAAGARQLASLSISARIESDCDILIFTGIASETDNFPIGDVRRHWNEAALKAKDAELEVYEGKVRQKAFEACRQLILKFEKTVG